jgi:hypothetical protein
MPRRADRIAHVVQAVEEGDEIEARARVGGGTATSKLTRSATPAAAARSRAAAIEGGW